MTNLLPDSVYSIYGFLSAAEADLLFELAAHVPPGGTIVEIGSFQGKSTVCLGLGAKRSGARVYAIDPHEDCQVNDATHYGMENHAALLKNLVHFEVADVVRVIAQHSITVSYLWTVPINLLWIDGAHEYFSVLSDLYAWSAFAHKIAIHDSSGHFPSVTKALTEFLMGKPWKVIQTVDATTLMERSDV